MRAVVIGVGSRWGDDFVGLAVARALAAGPLLPAAPRVLALERPGVDLVDALRGADFAVLVDALWRETGSGRVRLLSPPELAREPRAASSHGLGVASAVALGDALGVLPPEIAIVAVEIAHTSAAPVDSLSPPVAAAVEPACRMVRELLRGAASSASPRAFDPLPA